MTPNRLGHVLTIPAHISYWFLGAVFLLQLLSEHTGYDLSSLLPQEYYNKIRPYSHVATIVIILSLLVVVLDQFINRRNEHARWRHVFEELHTTLDAISSFRDEINRKVASSANWDRQDSDDFKQFVVLKYRELATKICNLFCTYTESVCHVSFKTLDESGMISTVARDQHAGSVERGRIDEHLISFPFAGNTAFRDILEKDKLDCYISNHLRLRSWLRMYKNVHDDWSKHYRAVAVAPITTTAHPANITRTNVYGFLCVDNRSGGFDKGVCRELLTHVARHLHQITVLLAQVHIAERSEPRNQKEEQHEGLSQNGQSTE